jgi:molybdopterin molybdotransferase
LRKASKDHDLIITSGGVSVGEEDHIKPAVTAEGRLDLWQIAIKPGKPLAFGAVRKSERPQDGEAWFIGLPGNPVSSFVTFLLFVRPFILKLQGRDVGPIHSYPMRADFDWLKADRRNEFLRVKMNQQGGLDLFPNQSSGVLTSASWGDGLVDCPPGQAIKVGDLVKYIPFNALLA